jgi:integrase
MNITNDPYIQNMYLSRNLKPATITSYTKIIQPYCEFINKTPTELITEAIEEEEQGIRKINRKIRTYQIKYRQHLITQNKSPLTIKNTMATIRSFYNEYEIELPKIKINVPLEEKLITKDDLIQKTDIIQVLKNTNIKYRAVILLMASSGMGSAEVRYLTINDFLKSIEITINEPFSIGELIQKVDKINIPLAIWRITRRKTRMPYFTFSSPESIDAILDYLQKREYKQGALKIDSYLFDVEGHQTASKSFVNYFEKLNER